MKLTALLLSVFIIVGCGSGKELQNDSTTMEEIPADTSVVEESTEIDTSEEDELRAQLEEQYRQQLYNEYQARANGVTSYYILAQQQFYSGQYQNALYLINKALRVKETADVIALKGSILLGLGATELFVEHWSKALEMDENVPIPFSSFIRKQLQEHGLVDENFERNY